MPDALTKALEQLGGNSRLMMIVVAAGAFGVLWALSQWAMSPAMVPLFSNQPLEEMGAMSQRLEEAGIDYRLERGGTLLSVPEDDLARARVTLAQEGFPAGAQPGWELFDEAAWGMTDFTQRVNYRRALEGELERTISQMRGVESARVHLAIQKSSVLRQNEPAAQASVVLALRSGARPEKAMVEGVSSLVAGSVEGILKENVTVLDDTGRLLSEDDADMGTTGLTTRQLSIQKEIESYLEDKAYQLVEPVVGGGNVTVRVAAALDFDQVGRTVETFDPEQQVTVRQDRSEIIPGNEDQGASSITLNSIYETPKSVETYSKSGAQVERLTVAVVVNERQVQEEGEELRSIPRTREELVRVEALVVNALGIDQERGDAITVVSLPFDRKALILEPAEEGLDIMALVHAGVRPTIGLVGLVLAFLLGLRLLSSLKESAPAQLRGGTQLSGSLPTSPESRREITDVPEGRRFISPVAPKVEVTDPNMTARVVRAWMTEA